MAAQVGLITAVCSKGAWGLLWLLLLLQQRSLC
jgi:hypothetical protein